MSENVATWRLNLTAEMMQYTGTNDAAMTEFLGTSDWKIVRGQIVLPGHWVYRNETGVGHVSNDALKDHGATVSLETEAQRVSVAANSIGYALTRRGVEMETEDMLAAAQRLADQGLLSER